MIQIFEATPCEHSSVAICGQASSPFLNIRCDQRGPSELVEGNIYQNLSEPALSTDLSSVMRGPVMQKGRIAIPRDF